MRDTIDMAREAGWKDLRDYDSEMRHDFFMGNTDSLKAFEALVRADEQEKYKWDIHSCGPTCKRYGCVAMREAVEAEREKSKHNEGVLMNALWKACGDDAQVVEATIESQGELK